MKGYISIVIPTKSYIRAYIISTLGEKPLINTSHNIGCKLYDMLHHKTNERRSEFASKRYNDSVKLYMNYHIFFHRGSHLRMHETNIRNFNIYMEKEIKSRFYWYMDFYCEMLPSFTSNLPAVRKDLGIDMEAWDDDSMKKDYYRYRERTGKGLFYKNIIPRDALFDRGALAIKK